MATAGGPPAVLRPVLAAADRMRTSMRLGTLVLVLMIPGLVATYAYLTEVNSKIQFSALETEGTDVIEPALLAMADTVAGRQPDLDAVRDAAAAEPELGLTVSLPGTADRLALTVALGQLIIDAANKSNLILDPDLDSFYVMDAQIVQLPKALVAAAQSAVPGTATGNAAVAAQAVHAGELSAAAESLRADVKTADDNTKMPGLADRLSPVGAAADALAKLATARAATISTPGPADVTPTADALRAAVTPLVVALRDLLDTRVDGFTRGRTIILVVAVGGFVLAAWFAAGVLWRTRHDVALAVTGVTAIADGDFGPRPLPAGRDELGDIGAALDTARSRLVEQGEELTRAHTIREQQTQVSFLHQRQAEIRLRDRAQSIIDDSTGLIAEELRLVTAQVADVRQAASTIDTEISATGAATTAVVDYARRAEEVISSLQQSLDRVGATTALVKGIAGQTRLLALNATIEAARAGELGLGFTVVADEVKELATTTAQSTEQIAQTITELDRDTAEMSRTIDAMVFGIGGVGEAAVSLRTTAAGQGEVVERLSDRMVQTIARVEEMSGLAAQLERRGADRIALSGPVPVTVPGTPEPVTGQLINISGGGLRLELDAATAARLSVGEMLDCRIGPASAPFTVHAQIIDREDDKFGLSFMITDDEMSDHLDAYVSSLIG